MAQVINEGWLSDHLTDTTCCLFYGCVSKVIEGQHIHTHNDFWNLVVLNSIFEDVFSCQEAIVAEESLVQDPFTEQ